MARLRHSRVRVYESVRTAHLERAHALTPAAIVFRGRRYDFDEDLAAGLELVQASRWGAARLVARSHVGGDRDRDPETLFAALELVHARRPDARFTVQTTSTLAPPPGVTVVPHLTHVEVRDLIASSTVVALATRPNLHASGMTVGLEALSTGRPVVATATASMDDYFPLDAADLVPPQDPAAMAEAVLDLLDDPGVATERGRHGREHVVSRHTTDTMCRALAEIVGR